MRIGELAKATGLTARTIRFYEAEGLLPDPSRTQSGYRIYGDTDVARLSFVLKAKRVGLSLRDIKGILHLHDRGEPTCLHVSALLDEKLAQVERAIADLQEFRVELTSLRSTTGTLVDCRPSGGHICGIIEGAGVSASSEALAWVGAKPDAR